MNKPLMCTAFPVPIELFISSHEFVTFPVPHPTRDGEQEVLGASLLPGVKHSSSFWAMSQHFLESVGAVSFLFH